MTTTIEKRILRPSLESFFESRGHLNLPVYSRKAVKSRFSRNANAAQGYMVKCDSLGRSRSIKTSTAESIRTWIRMHLSHVVDVDTLSVVVDSEDGQPAIKIYRLA